jgi:signal transduction histidine kinase
MARELHDVVAHSVSIIAVQAGAAEMLVADDPQAARTHMESVRRTAHEALGELRRLVGVLRDDEAVLDPQPGLARLGELLDDARSTGLPVELITEGEPRKVPPGLDLAAYRIVQEGLTNVRRHAGPVPTQVRVRYEPDLLEVEVENAPGRRNGGSGEGTGHGLIGMRERARLYGGSLEVGEQPGGGFRVRARLPLEVEA